jgi:hypothetical protein
MKRNCNSKNFPKNLKRLRNILKSIKCTHIIILVEEEKRIFPQFHTTQG